MKEILIHAKIKDDEVGYVVRTRGFDEATPISKAFEILGVMNYLKDQEVLKLNNGFEDNKNGK